jgi:hypothetical protein
MILKSCEHIFEPPVVREYDSSTPECVRLLPESEPSNRPAFCLSLPERQEVEKQVRELLQAGRTLLPARRTEHLCSLCQNPMDPKECALIIGN